MKEVTKEEFLAMQENNEKIAIDIWAEWCQPCKMLKPILTNLTIPENIKLVSLDFDKNKEFVTSLNVRSIPTVILFNGKDEINRMVGVKQFNDYNENISKLSNL
jgi:thioredoxin 1